MTKTKLRQIMRTRKKDLTDNEISSESRVITEKLLQTPEYRNADMLFVYLSYNREVRTDELIRQAFSDGKRVAVPKITENRMIFVELHSNSVIQNGYKSIPEPADNTEVINADALMLLPGLAFDKAGNRCGYGGGFYDRYLSLHPMNTRIGLCYQFQLLDAIPYDSNDIPVKLVITS